jgi:hypothetical protein
MSDSSRSSLPAVKFMAFPFRMTHDGAAVSGRTDHVRERIEEVLFTSPGERVFRPDFGFGARRHVFEPNSKPLWDAAQSRLFGALSDALAGDVDPKTLRVTVGAPADTPEVLLVTISYTLAALQKVESYSYTV